MKTPEPRAALRTFDGYTPRRRDPQIDLYLDANEGPQRTSLNIDPQSLAATARDYPSHDQLQRVLANYAGRPEDQVVVTAGADDAIDRVCRAYLDERRGLVVATPTFGMIPRYAQLAGASVTALPWVNGWPIEEALAIDPDTVGVVAVVTPNNPTGAVVPAQTVARLSDAFPQAIILVDAAYGEFADDDWPLREAVAANVVVVRTLSKAWGLAGLRVGYALADSAIATVLRQVGSPYPVAGPSADIGAGRVESGAAFLRPAVDRVRRERAELSALLSELGARPAASQGNFVLSAFDDADWVARSLRSFGIQVRSFAGDLANSLRITCPCDPDAFSRLTVGLRAALRPEAILFDMDGVLADVSGSYREAIVQTAASYGVQLSLSDIAAAKRAGDANDDWTVTWRLVQQQGVITSLTEVTSRFEALYQDGPDALWRRETTLIDRGPLADLRDRVSTGIVTGRPRGDADRFLENARMSDLFGAVVTRDDAPLKPQPDGIRLALRQLCAKAACYIGDTPDDMWAARRAGVLPVGVIAPGEDRDATRAALEQAGAVVVFDNANEVAQWLR